MGSDKPSESKDMMGLTIRISRDRMRPLPQRSKERSGQWGKDAAGRDAAENLVMPGELENAFYQVVALQPRMVDQYRR